MILSSFYNAGKTRARDAALNAIQSPLLDIGIERATGIVWNITGGSDLTLFEVGCYAADLSSYIFSFAYHTHSWYLWFRYKFLGVTSIHLNQSDTCNKYLPKMLVWQWKKKNHWNSFNTSQTLLTSDTVK